MAIWVTFVLLNGTNEPDILASRQIFAVPRIGEGVRFAGTDYSRAALKVNDVQWEIKEDPQDHQMQVIVYLDSYGDLA